MVKNITNDYFNKNVYNIKNTEKDGELKFLGDKPVVVDFHAKWCGPCKVLGPVLEDLDKDYNGNLDIYKVDIEDEMELAQTFGVMSVPTLLFIPTEGKPSMSPGAPSKDQLKEIIDEKLLNKETKKSDIQEQVSKFQSIMNKIKAALS